MMKTLSLHMQANNGVSTNMRIVYVAPVQNKAGIHFMVNLSDHEVQRHNNKNSY
jgi:N-acetylmuramoyl-L-alanine amidase CwlA